MTLSALTEDIIGISFVFEEASLSEGRLSGRPAPANIMSMPSSMADFASSSKFLAATIIFTPIIPFVSSLAFLIIFLRALLFALI